MKKLTKILGVSLTTVALLAGCGKQNVIQGEWEDTNDYTSTMTFKKDKMILETAGGKAEGTYTIEEFDKELDGYRLKIEFDDGDIISEDIYFNTNKDSFNINDPSSESGIQSFDKID